MEKLTLILVALILAAGIYYQIEHPHSVKKDCQLAEISPDFTMQERENCRRGRN